MSTPFEPLKVDIGIYADPEDDDDMGFFRGPMLTRRKKETYKEFIARVTKSAQKLVDEYNSIPELKKQIIELKKKAFWLPLPGR